MTTILLIEDNAPLRRNIAEILTMEGHHVRSAGDAETGLKLAHEQKPDLILCDIMMPGIDGHEVLARVRANTALTSVPFIFITAKGELPDIRAGMTLGADDYLPKPVERADLLDAVRTRLTRHSQQRQAQTLCFDDARPLERLGVSPREAEILLWMAQGKSNGDVAAILGISLGTVKKHTNHIFEKIGVESRTAAVLRAIEVLAGVA